MKLMAFTLAGVLAASVLPAGPAEAQRWRDGWRGDRGWHDDGYREGRRHWDRGRHWNSGRHWDRGRGWDRGRRWYGRPRYRNACRWQRGYDGPVRRCFRVRF